MMIFASCLLVIGIILIVLLSFPVVVRLHSSLEFVVQWTFIKFWIVVSGNSVTTELHILGIKRAPKKEKEKESSKPSKKKKDKQKKKITAALVWEILGDSAVKKILFQAYHFLRRLIKSVRISTLRLDFSLDDYYWQGILMGAVTGLPQTDNFRISGNFEEKNDWFVLIKISLWRILSATLLLLFCFPYLKALRLYRKIK